MSEIPTPPPVPPHVQGVVSPEEKNWGVIAHLSALAGYVAPIIGCIIGPLVVFLNKNDQIPLAAGEAKAALNFQITMAIPAILCVPLVFLCIGIPLLVMIGIVDLIFIIVAAVRAGEGKPYRYPIAIPFVK